MVSFATPKNYFNRGLNPTPKMLALLVLVVVVIAGAVVFGLWLVRFRQVKPPEATLPEGPPIVNPEGKAAFKYYPKGGSAPDFRDGSNGPLTVTMERNGDQVILNWDSTIKVAVVRVLDLGQIYNLSDEKLVWQIQNYDPQKPTATQAKNQPAIAPPYQLGEMPDGFFAAQKLAPELQLKKDARYSVELLGANQEGLPILGVYTFTY
jgi:hypothetical protein